MSALAVNASYRSMLWWVAVLTACLGLGIYLSNPEDAALSKAAEPQQPHQATNVLPGPGSTGGPNVSGIEQLSGQSPMPVNPLDSVKPPQFRANTSGELVIDEAFRTDLERVYGLYQGPDVLNKLEEFSVHLPDKARQALRDQYQRYVKYDAAVMQNMSALKTQEEMTLELAERELTQLHDLRQTYFGEEAANAMFAQEEAQSKELHDYIRQHTDPALPMMQRVELAQAAWLKAHQTSETPSASAK